MKPRPYSTLEGEDAGWVNRRVTRFLRPATDRPAAQEAFAIQARNLAKLTEVGVRIAFGTDGNVGWSPHVEMADMVAAGMTPAQVIVAATRNSADLLQLTDVGMVEAYVNDWEGGLIEDFRVWLEKLAPAGLPYKHHQTGEDNADAHLKRTIMGHQVTLPITRGKLDLGPWEQVFYAEFDGRRKKRVVVKIMGKRAKAPTSSCSTRIRWTTSPIRGESARFTCAERRSTAPP